LLSDPFEETPKQKRTNKGEGTISSVKSTKDDYMEQHAPHDIIKEKEYKPREDDKYTPSVRREQHKTEKKHVTEGYSTTSKKNTRLISDKLGSTQPIAYRSSTQCSTTNISPVIESKTLPRILLKDCATCTNSSLNQLETSNVSNINIINTCTKKKIKLMTKENLQHSSVIDERLNYRVVMKGLLKKRRNTGTCLEQFKRNFHEKLNNINDTLAQRYKAEIEHHKNIIKIIPVTISTPRIRLRHAWAKDLIHRQEQISYQF